jgi:hypothetical protein
MLHRTPLVARAARSLAAITALVAAAALTHGLGCAAGNDASCRVGADCVSGACLDGKCVPESTVDARADGAGDIGADAAIDVGGDGAKDGGVPGCTPNHDGTITADEVPLAAGLHATFRVAQGATFSTAGTTSGGKRTWDLSGALAGDKDVLVETLPLAGKWFAPQFSTGTYATPLSSASDLLGIFQVTAASLNLLGVASPTDSATHTELTYATPISTLKFPLTEGASWSVTSNVTGPTSGVPSAFVETYQFSVDAHGDVVTPFGTFPSLRVKIVLTRNAGVLTVTRTYAFVTECFGTIASVVSNPNELSEEFTNAAEVRRLSP